MSARIRPRPPLKPFELDFLPVENRETIIEELQRVALKLGTRVVSALDVQAHAKVSIQAIQKHFGRLNDAMAAAGLESAGPRHFTRHEVLTGLRNLMELVRVEHNRTPRAEDLKRYKVGFSSEPVRKHFRTWRAAVIEASKYDPSNPVEHDNLNRSAPRNSTRRRSISLKLRYKILSRDNYRCRMCGRSGIPLEVDHIIPVAAGGTNDPTNLQTACKDCNRGKQDTPPPSA